MTINEFLVLCKKKMALLIVLPLIFALGAGIFAYGFMTNDYTSTVSIYVLTRNNNNNNNSSVTYNDVTASQQISNDVAVLVKSNRVADSVKSEMGLDNLDNFKIKVTSAEKNRVINLSVTGKNPKSTAQVVNCIARQTAALAVEVMNVDAVNIIEEAQPSTVPSGPNRPLIVLIAFFAGLFVAIAIIIIQDMLDITIKDENEIKTVYDLPVLAQIPYVKKLK